MIRKGSKKRADSFLTSISSKNHRKSDEDLAWINQDGKKLVVDLEDDTDGDTEDFLEEGIKEPVVKERRKTDAKVEKSSQAPLPTVESVQVLEEIEEPMLQVLEEIETQEEVPLSPVVIEESVPDIKEHSMKEETVFGTEETFIGPFNIREDIPVAKESIKVREEPQVVNEPVKVTKKLVKVREEIPVAKESVKVKEEPKVVTEPAKVKEESPFAREPALTKKLSSGMRPDLVKDRQKRKEKLIKEKKEKMKEEKKKLALEKMGKNSRQDNAPLPMVSPRSMPEDRLPTNILNEDFHSVNDQLELAPPPPTKETFPRQSRKFDASIPLEEQDLYDIPPKNLQERPSIKRAPESFHMVCSACNKVIPTIATLCGDKKYHKECFKCSRCHKPVFSSSFYEIDQSVCCVPCYNEHRNNTANVCKRCDKKIFTEILTALDATWHPDCFLCYKCSTPISTTLFFLDSNKNPLCGCK